jgi:hypothetical protein
MKLEELLAELKTYGLNIASGEHVELYKDDDFTDGLMIAYSAVIWTPNPVLTGHCGVRTKTWT